MINNCLKGMQTFILVLLAIIKVDGLPALFRVVGGSETFISKYPSAAVVLECDGHLLIQICGGTIINEKYILTAAHCFRSGNSAATDPEQYRIRVGSTCANIGGSLHEIKTIIFHPEWNKNTHDSDMALMRTTSDITFGYTKQPAVLPGSDYHLPDNASLWAIGWGFIRERGPASEVLRHVLVHSIDQELCQKYYGRYFKVTENMMCSGWLDGGGRDQCTYDSGSPIYHNHILVGVASLGVGCGNPRYPAVNVRISRFTDWIQAVTRSTNVSSSLKRSPKWVITLSYQINLSLESRADCASVRI